MAGLSTYHVESDGVGSQSESGSQAEDNVELHGEDVCLLKMKVGLKRKTESLGDD